MLQGLCYKALGDITLCVTVPFRFHRQSLFTCLPFLSQVGGNPYTRAVRLPTPIELQALYAGFVQLRTLSLPTVAAVHGALVGGALASCLNTDYIVAEAGSTFEHGNLVRGLCPLGMLSQSFNLAVGQVSVHVYLQNATINASTARVLGLVQDMYIGVAKTQAQACLSALHHAVHMDLSSFISRRRQRIDSASIDIEAVGNAECVEWNYGFARSTLTDCMGLQPQDLHFVPLRSHSHRTLFHDMLANELKRVGSPQRFFFPSSQDAAIYCKQLMASTHQKAWLKVMVETKQIEVTIAWENVTERVSEEARATSAARARRVLQSDKLILHETFSGSGTQPLLWQYRCPATALHESSGVLRISISGAHAAHYGDIAKLELHAARVVLICITAPALDDGYGDEIERRQSHLATLPSVRSHEQARLLLRYLHSLGIPIVCAVNSTATNQGVTRLLWLGSDYRCAHAQIPCMFTHCMILTHCAAQDNG